MTWCARGNALPRDRRDAVVIEYVGLGLIVWLILWTVAKVLTLCGL